MKLPRENIDLVEYGKGTAKFWANYKSWLVWQFHLYGKSFFGLFEFLSDGFKAFWDALGHFSYSIIIVFILILFPIIAPFIALYNMKKYRKIYMEEFGLKKLLMWRRRRLKEMKRKDNE